MPQDLDYHDKGETEADDLYAQEAEQAAQAKRNMMQSLANALLTKRAEAIEYRSASGVEKKWREDEIVFDGLDGSSPLPMLDYATGEATRISQKRESKRSKVIVNIVRGRCETAEGRFAEILLPVDDRNWGLKVTPVPELTEQLTDDRPAMQNGKQIADAQGQPSSMADVAKDKKEKAKKAMKLMEMVIDDQLTECDYNSESRKAVRNAVRLGTGILKGPTVINSVKQTWQQQTNSETGNSVHSLEQLEETTPSSVSVSPWSVYPSPGTKENIQKTAEYIWEKDEILPRDVRSLIGVDGYDDEQLMLVLQEEPMRVRAAADTRNQQSNVAQIDTVRMGMAYEKWEYHGDVGIDDLLAMGVECGEASAQSISAVVVFINDRPVRIELNTLDTGHLPYDFFQWTIVSSEYPWGIGIPRMMMWLQRIITSAWRKLMDNAGDSAGRHVIINGSVQPADGVMEMGGDKLWIATGDMEEASKAFAQFQLASNQPQLQAIIELALRFVDLETSLPTIFQGEAQEAPETLGATNIMVDSSNISVRQRVKLYDDRITRPHITRYYHHNMQYNPDNAIKGDFNVDPRGTSVLLERDQQSMVLGQVFSMKQDPDFNMMVDWPKAVKTFLAAKKLDILKSDTEIEQALKQAQEAPQEAPPAPAIQVAQIRGQNDMEKENLRQQSDMAELQFKAEQADMERVHDKEMKQMDYEIKMMEYSEKRGIEIDKLKVQLSMGSAGMNLQREMAGKKESTNKTPQVTTPPTEPVGRAPAGQAYQR